MKVDFTEVYGILNANSNLKTFFNWYIKNCTSLTLPYHNLNHTLGMICHIIQIHKLSQYKYKEYGFKLTNEDLYVLILSAMFHDYNHSGGQFTDDVNVNIAKAGLRDCIDEVTDNNDTIMQIYKICCDIIDATQYPYVISDENLTVQQRIIRECDILVCFFDDFITHNIFGLKEEMKTGLDIQEYTSSYLKFIIESLNKLKLKYSKDLINENQNEFLNTVDKFSQLILN